MLSVAIAFLSVCRLVVASDSFCADGINILDLDAGVDVTVTYVQAPLNSVNGSQSAKYLNLFHTALVFRQGQEDDADSKWWTLEFDNAGSNLLASLVPMVTDEDELNWGLDARWCLRKGIYNGRAHWTKSWTDTAIISSANFEHLIYEWMLQYNATVPGAWPQYSFFRISDALGDVLLDDMTCSHVYWLLSYARDSLGATMKTELESLKASRSVIHAATLLPLSGNETEHALMVGWYRGFAAAIQKQANLVDQLNVIFQAVVPMQFVYDPNLKQYYKVVFAIPDIVSLFSVHYEPLGRLPEPPAPSPGACNVNSRCSQVMAEQCEQGTGYLCEACLGAKSSTLIAGTCPLDPLDLMSSVSCFCHGKCGVSDHCLEWMRKVCKPGLGCHLCLTVNLADLLLIGGCGPLTSLASQSCFCNGGGGDGDALLLDDDPELDEPGFVA